MRTDWKASLGRALAVLALSALAAISHAGPGHMDPMPGGDSREGSTHARLQLPIALLTEKGVPVAAGGLVVVRCSGEDSEPAEIEEGLVEIEGPSQTAECQLWARAPHRGFSVTTVNLPQHSDGAVHLELPAARAVRLRLVNSISGEYLEAEVVWRLRWRATPTASELEVPAGMFDDRQAEADRDWLLAGLPPGLYALEIHVEGFVPRIIDGLRLDSSGKPLDLGDVTLSPVARLCGRIDGHTGDDAVAVRWRRTDGVARGFVPISGDTFCIEDLAVGREHAVWAVGGGRESEGVRVVPPRDDVELTLPSTRRVRVHVMREDDHSVIEGFRIKKAWIHRRGSRVDTFPIPDGETVVDSPTGSVELELPPVDDIALVFTAEGFAPATEIVSADAEEELELDVYLVPGATVEGTVVSSLYGDPLWGAAVELTCQGVASLSRSTATDENGRYSIGDLPEDLESCVVVASSPGHAPGRAELGPVGSSGSVVVDLSLGKGEDFRARLLDGGQLPVAGATVTLYVPDGSATRTEQSDSDGRVEFRNVTEGAAMLRVTHPDFRALRKTVNVPPPVPGAEHIVHLERGVEWIGTVNGLGGDGNQATVILMKNGEQFRTITGYGGRFVVRSGPDGDVGYVVQHATLREPCSGSLWVPSDVSTWDAEIVCSSAGFVVTGTIVNPKGNAVADAVLALNSNDGLGRTYVAQSTQAGTFEFRNVKSGEYLLKAVLGPGKISMPWSGYLGGPQEIHVVLQ